jgi:hypothetical protein
VERVFCFYTTKYRNKRTKGESQMAEEQRRSDKSSKPSPALSLDSWAVILALALSLAIWIGWIKHVPW